MIIRNFFQSLIVLKMFFWLFVCVLGDSLPEKNGQRSKLTKRVQKFSIGRDFNSLELSENDMLQIINNSVYTNFPALLSTKSIKDLKNNLKNIKTKFYSSISPTNLPRNSTLDKLEKLKKKLTLVKEKARMSSIINEVFDDVLSTKSIDFSKIAKGRSIEDTKKVLNYMLTSLYQIEAEKESNHFDSMKFFDQVYLNPLDVSPDGLFESDIVLSKQQAYRIFSKYLPKSYDELNVRKVIRDTVHRWNLPIRFYLDPKYNDKEKKIIRDAFKRWEESTCLEFREIFYLNTQVHYLRVTRGQGCWSPIGFLKDSKYQELSLGPGCIYKGTVLHEIGHTLGFFHEQSRPDRDDYIDIIRNNIAKYGEINFEKYSDNEISKFGVPYDLASDMHYASLSFSSNNKATITPKDKRYQRTIGQRNDLSFSDIKTANNAYCQNKCSFSLPCQRGGYPNPKDCRKCLCPDGFSGEFCDQVAPSKGICGGFMTNFTGILETPNYPLYYPGFISCNWLIKAPVGYRVRLAFSKIFSTTCEILSSFGPCDQDWLEIRDDQKLFYQGGPRYCCSQAPNTTISLENEILVLFRSSAANVNSNGFRAYYDFIDKNENTILSTNFVSTTVSSIDPCEQNPCLNSGTCDRTNKGFKCLCKIGWTGNKCEARLSKCSQIKCLNNGICLENLDSCLCQPGFTGEKCEKAIDACESNPCVKGICVNMGDNMGYKCYCLTNYTGPRCETILTKKYCRPNLCLNNGRCIESPFMEGFLCKCTSNYYGIFCEKDICSRENICGSGMCFLKEKGGYYCKCPDGTTGENCKSHPCSTGICGQHGTCERTGSFNYKCKCAPGYFGTHCDSKLSTCFSNPCVNGKCLEQNDKDFECECNFGFVGKKCDIPFFSNLTQSVCNSNPCINNGICFERRDSVSDYICFCPPGFIGLHCEIAVELDEAICQNGLCKQGTCVFSNQSQVCQCNKNWHGARCDKFDPCSNPNPCQNNGKCLLRPNDEFICSCANGFSGKNCEIHPKKKCSNLCLNGGTCIPDRKNRNGFRCLCSPNFVGPNCLYNINSCSSNPCDDNQICTNKGYSYDCRSFYKRTSLSLSTKSTFANLILFPKSKTTRYICTNNPCKNNSTCHQISNFEYQCICKRGFTGKFCNDLDECLLNKSYCKNNGKCVIKDGRAACKCRPGFQEPHCDRLIDMFKFRPYNSTFCEINVCQNGGKCIHSDLYNNKVFGMKCLCETGFSGFFCEIEMHSPKSNTFYKSRHVPHICQSTLNQTLNLPLRMVKLPYTNSSFYVIQSDLVWYINEGSIENDVQKWPVRITDLFPGVEIDIDAIIYDYLNNEILIFKANKYWKFKKVLNKKHSYNLMNDGAVMIKSDFGLTNVESGLFLNENSLFLIRDSKIVHYDKTKALAIYFLPFRVNDIQFSIPFDQNKFYILGTNRLYLFYINPKKHQVFVESIDSDLINSFFCQPFTKARSTILENSSKIQKYIRPCPDLLNINSIVKLNSTAALVYYKGNIIEYVEYGINGYKFFENTYNYVLDLDSRSKTDLKYSMINLNRILFVFQNDAVWLFSMMDNEIIKSSLPALFSDLFPNKIGLESIVSAHYSSSSQKFYFFTEKYYIEYENEKKILRRDSIRNLSSNLTNVIQNHEDNDSVYLVDSNNFVYFLNLKTDYLESIERRTVNIKLFDNCIHQ